MPKLKGHNSDHEAAIGKRLREHREAQGMSQADVVDIVGISRSKLANIECGRTSLHAGLGLSLCNGLSLNPRWLAEGIDPEFPYQEISETLLLQINPDALFSTEYARILKPGFDELWSVLSATKTPGGAAPNYHEILSLFPPVGTPPRDEIWFFLHKKLQRHWRRLGSFDLQEKLADALSDCLHHFFEENRAEIEAAREKSLAAWRSENIPIESIKQASLDILQTILQPAFDMATLDQWIKRLRKVCERRGAMSELARKLNVSRQAIAQWLTTDPEVRTRPSGELVLPLLEWVQAEEVNQQKNSASVPAPAEPKTRRKTNSNEDQTSGRKKR